MAEGGLRDEGDEEAAAIVSGLTNNTDAISLWISVVSTVREGSLLFAKKMATMRSTWKVGRHEGGEGSTRKVDRFFLEALVKHLQELDLCEHEVQTLLLGG